MAGKLGLFVYVPDHRYIGKVSALDEETIEVSFFHSLAKREVDRFLEKDCKRAFLYPETRVVAKREDGRIESGRVRDYFRQEDSSIDYEIRFTHGDTEDVSERDLEVRCLRPDPDPAELLAHFGGETQFLYDRRWPALQTIIELEAASQGLSGLVSAAIEGIPHQAIAARRVLQDPLPRFLLADEVGLGKTIETGVILRQWLLDDPALEVLLLAPKPLLAQWSRELSGRFGLVDSHISYVSYDDTISFKGEAPDVVVIDEAHHVTSSANISTSKEVLKVAKKAARLLLISAIPPLADPEAFLGLLRLIDPDIYASESTESFQALIDQRQEYGRLLLGLRPDAAAFVLQQRASAVQERFPDDDFAQDLAAQLLSAEDTDERTRLCLALRDHIADTYRIHHRIVRSRRSDCPDWVFMPRGPQTQDGDPEDVSHIGVDPDEDPRGSDLSLALEDWRLAACAELEPNWPETQERKLRKRFRNLLETFGKGILGLGSLAERLDPLFDGEEAYLGEIIRIANQAQPERNRFTVATNAVRDILRSLSSEGVKLPKLIVFVTERETANTLSDYLANAFGEHLVMKGWTHESADSSASIVFESDEAQILVLDEGGEEGLNLQYCHALVHFDFPFSIERIEQRIGRLDRFGQKSEAIKQRILIPSAENVSPWSNWIDVLGQGFGIFNRSVSDIQFLLEDFEQEIERTFLRFGALNIDRLIADIKQRVRDERNALDEQYVLDEIVISNETGEQLVDNIEDAEADETALAAPIEEWLFRVLQFQRRDLPDFGPDIFSIKWRRNTLVPKDPWDMFFDPALDRPLTWKRRIARNQIDVALLRPGSDLFEALTRLIRWDSRGTAFATWRFAPEIGFENMWLGFRLCFVVEPALSESNAVLTGPRTMALRRRAVSFLSPWTSTIHLDVSLAEVIDPMVLSILEVPFKSGNYFDIDLIRNLDVLPQAIDRVQFSDLCTSVKERGFDLISQSPEFIERVSIAERVAGDAAERHARRIQLRPNSETEFDGDAFDLEVIEAVKKPDVRLDSIGFFVLSGHKPQLSLN